MVALEHFQHYCRCADRAATAGSGEPCSYAIIENALSWVVRYFQWTGPATLAEFQHLVESESSRLLPADLADDLAAFKIQKEPIYALIGSIDSVLLLRRDLKSMIDGEDFRSLVQASAAVSNSAVWRNSQPRDRDRLEAFTRAFHDSPADACADFAKQREYCEWVPAGVAVRPEVPKIVDGVARWPVQ